MTFVYVAIVALGFIVAAAFQEYKEVTCEKALEKSEQCQKRYTKSSCDDVYVPDICIDKD